MRKRLFLLIAAAGVLLVSACATLDRPFIAEADRPLNRQVAEAVKDYPDVLTTAVGGRVYVEGWVNDFAEQQTVLSRIREIPGVTQIMDRMQLTEPGSNGDWDRWE